MERTVRSLEVSRHRRLEVVEMQSRLTHACRAGDGRSRTSLAALSVAALILSSLLIGTQSARAQSSTTSSLTGSLPIEIYKDYDAWWGDCSDEEVLNMSGIHKGAKGGYGVLPTSALMSPIPAGTKLAIPTSNSCGWDSAGASVN